MRRPQQLPGPGDDGLEQLVQIQPADQSQRRGVQRSQVFVLLL